MNNKPIADVSIVSANYNNGAYLAQFIESIYSSTYLPKELIIIDDGSTDNSIEVIRKYNYDFIKLIHFDNNRGFANALNEGVKLAVGKYILRVDPDDYIVPYRIEEQFKFLESNPEIDLVGSNVSYFDSDTGERVFNSNVPIEQDDIVCALRSGYCSIIHGSMMCKCLIMLHFPYNQENVPAEDYELLSLILREGHAVRNLSDALTFVRIHVNSISNNLPFYTIQKTFQLNEKIWGVKNSRFKVRRIYLHLKYYRKFLFCKGGMKYIYLLFSLFFNPIKLVSRLIRYFN